MATLLRKEFQAERYDIYTLGFIDVGGTHTKTALSKPQASNAVGTSQNLTQSLMA